MSFMLFSDTFDLHSENRPLMGGFFGGGSVSFLGGGGLRRLFLFSVH